MRMFSRGAWLLPLLVCGCFAPPTFESPADRGNRALGIGDAIIEIAQAEPLDAIESSPDRITAADALRLALRHDAALQAALADVRIAQADAKQTRLLANPIIAVAYRFPSGGGKSVIDADITADLLSLLTRPGRVRAADARLRGAAAEALRVVLDVAAEVQTQYALAQSLDARVQLTQQRRQTLTQLSSIAQARFEAGEASRLDLLTAQGELASQETQRIALESEQRLARITLAKLLGQPRSIGKWKLSPWEPPSRDEIDDEPRTDFALQHRPELEAIRWELAALGQEAKLARATTLLGGSVGASAERDDIWSIGPTASLPLPIFDTGRVAQSRVRSQIARQSHLLTQKSREVIEDVRRAIETSRAARAALESIEREMLPLQQQRLEQAEAAYRAGLTDIVAFRLAEQELQEARTQQIELQAQLTTAAIALDRAAGGAIRVPSTTEPRP